MKYSRCVLVIILAVVCPAFAWGNEFRIVPSISVQEAYNSNILFSADDARRDFITTVSPGLEMVNRTERLDSDMLFKFDRFDYARNSGLSTTDQAYSGKLRYLVSPLFSISAEAAYVRDSRPDRDVGTTGIVLTTAPRRRLASSLSADYRLSEKAAVGVSYNYGRDHFGGLDYLNDESHDLGAGLVYDLGEYVPTLKGMVNAGYSYYRTSYLQLDSAITTVGFSRDINETWAVRVEGGVRRTWSKVALAWFTPVFDSSLGSPILLGYEQVKEQVKNNGWGWTGTVSLNYKGERGDGSLAYSRDILPASGLDGAAERDSVTLSARYRLTYELSLFLTSDYYANKSDPSKFSAQVIDWQTFRINPGIHYEFSKDSGVEAAYRQ